MVSTSRTRTHGQRRLIQEQRFLQHRCHSFFFQPTINLCPPSQPRVHFELPNLTWVTKPLQDFSPDDCRRYCWKDCMIYVNSSDMHSGHHHDIFNIVYQHWWPRRGLEKDITQGNFFAEVMRLRPPATLAEIAALHAGLCDHVGSLTSRIKRQEGPVQRHGWQDSNVGVEGDVTFELRPTFCKVFLEVDSRGGKRVDLCLSREKQSYCCGFWAGSKRHDVFRRPWLLVRCSAHDDGACDERYHLQRRDQATAQYEKNDFNDLGS